MVYHMPAAHTDGDSVVFFRRSDVISAGDIFTPNNYPFLDLARGGSVQGEIDALNHIIELTVPAKYQEGGTYVIPGHGRLCEEADVVEYRDMVTIIRDRIQDLIRKGKTLDQVKAAKPTLDYDTQYGTQPARRSLCRGRVQEPGGQVMRIVPGFLLFRRCDGRFPVCPGRARRTSAASEEPERRGSG